MQAPKLYHNAATTLGILSIATAILAIVISVIVPEARAFFGLENNDTTPPASKKASTQEENNNPIEGSTIPPLPPCNINEVTVQLRSETSCICTSGSSCINGTCVSNQSPNSPPDIIETDEDECAGDDCEDQLDCDDDNCELDESTTICGEEEECSEENERADDVCEDQHDCDDDNCELDESTTNCGENEECSEEDECAGDDCEDQLDCDDNDCELDESVTYCNNDEECPYEGDHCKLGICTRTNFCGDDDCTYDEITNCCKDCGCFQSDLYCDKSNNCERKSLKLKIFGPFFSQAEMINEVKRHLLLDTIFQLERGLSKKDAELKVNLMYWCSGRGDCSNRKYVFVFNHHGVSWMSDVVGFDSDGPDSNSILIVQNKVVSSESFYLELDLNNRYTVQAPDSNNHNIISLERTLRSKLDCELKNTFFLTCLYDHYSVD